MKINPMQGFLQDLNKIKKRRFTLRFFCIFYIPMANKNLTISSLPHESLLNKRAQNKPYLQIRCFLSFPVSF